MNVIIGLMGAFIIFSVIIYYIKVSYEKNQDQQKRSFHDIKEMVDRMRMARMDKKEKNIEKLEENTYEEDISDIDKLNNIIK